MANNKVQPLHVCENSAYALKQVKGSKLTFLACLLVILLVTVVLGMLSALLGLRGETFGIIGQVLCQVVGYLMQMSLAYLGILRAKNLPVRFKQFFYVFEFEVLTRVLGVYVLQVSIGLVYIFVCVIIPVVSIFVIDAFYNTQLFIHLVDRTGLMGVVLAFWLVSVMCGFIYLLASLMMSNAYALDQNINAWQAVKKGYAASKNIILELIFVIGIQMAAIVIGAMLFGIGLLWALPFVAILYGTTYIKLAGIKVKAK